MRRWGMSAHAAKRIMDMCVPPQAVRETLERPDRTYVRSYRDSHDSAAKQRRLLCKGDLTLVVDLEGDYIVTALWRVGDKSDRDNPQRIWDQGGWTDY